MRLNPTRTSSSSAWRWRQHPHPSAPGASWPLSRCLQLLKLAWRWAVWQLLNMVMVWHLSWDLAQKRWWRVWPAPAVATSSVTLVCWNDPPEACLEAASLKINNYTMPISPAVFFVWRLLPWKWTTTQCRPVLQYLSVCHVHNVQWFLLPQLWLMLGQHCAGYRMLISSYSSAPLWSHSWQEGVYCLWLKSSSETRCQWISRICLTLINHNETILAS